MGKILCATRGGEASYRTQDAVIEKAQAEDAVILFLYAADINFLRTTSHGVRPDIIRNEMDRMGDFLLTMAVERAAKQGVKAEKVLVLPPEGSVDFSRSGRKLNLARLTPRTLVAIEY